MKFRNLALAIATSALLQTLAFADDYGDAIRASFIRDLNHEIAARYLPSARVEADPLDVIDVVLRGEKPVASRKLSLDHLANGY